MRLFFLLQYWKLSRQSNKNAEQCMGRLRTMAAECKYKELDRCLKEQFVNGLNDDVMMVEIIFELTSMLDTSSVTSKQVFAWTRRVEAQRMQAAMPDSLKETKDFDAIRLQKTGQKQNRLHQKNKRTDHHPKQKCKYFGSSHSPKQCPAYGKMSGGCGKINTFWAVCRSKDSRRGTVHEIEQNTVTRLMWGISIP